MKGGCTSKTVVLACKMGSSPISPIKITHILLGFALALLVHVLNIEYCYVEKTEATKKGGGFILRVMATITPNWAPGV